jgi:hypothetical protein
LGALIDDLVHHDIPVKTFILDDGWENVKVYRSGLAPDGLRCTTGPESERGYWQLRGLWDFDSNPGIGSDGLRGIQQLVQRKLGSDCQFGVWLA